MTVFTLFPSYVQANYHSSRGVHVAIMPTLQWSPGGSNGVFETWDSVGVDADTMIQEFFDAYFPLFPTTVEFDSYTIFNFPDEDSHPEPVSFGALGQVGTGNAATTTWVAIQATITWQCGGGFILKTVGLDAVASANFAKTGPLTIATQIPDVVAAITGSGNGWASRAGTQPLFGKQIAYTVNEKLRRNYNLN